MVICHSSRVCTKQADAFDNDGALARRDRAGWQFGSSVLLPVASTAIPTQLLEVEHGGQMTKKIPHEFLSKVFSIETSTADDSGYSTPADAMLATRAGL
jgi:hypothetical protein